MSNLLNLIEEKERASHLEEQMAPLRALLDECTAKINTINKTLTPQEKKFIAEKLYQNFTDKEKEDIEKDRKERESFVPKPYASSSSIDSNGNYSKSVYFTSRLSTIFDPFYDKWKIVSIDKKEGKIIFGVSCIKNEGSISGLMTIYNMHYTVPIEKSELEGIDNSIFSGIF